MDLVAWQELDKHYPNFAMEPRNVRMRLASDGFNHMGNFSSTHSMWPILAVYNLPPLLCIK